MFDNLSKGLLLFAFLVPHSIALECFIQGACLESTILTEFTTDSSKECLKECQNTQDCTWFTFYSDYAFCILLRNCNKLEVSGYENCTSGEKACKAFDCFVTGRCSGTLLAITQEIDAEDCLVACQSLPSCGWFTYDKEDGACLAMENCDLVEDPSFISGEAGCSVSAFGENQLTLLNSMEVIDMSKQGRECPTLTNSVYAPYGAAGDLLQDKPTLCGGFNLLGNHTNEIGCWQYNTDTNTWNRVAEMTEERIDLAAVVIDRTTLWITGGYYGDSNTDLLEDSADGSISIRPGPKLPTTLAMHCIVQVNETHTLFTGGSVYGAESFTNTAFFYDWAQGQFQSTGAMNWKRGFHGCAKLISELNKIYILVVGGSGNNQESAGSAELFDVENGSWEIIEPPPVALERASAIDLSDNSALVIGGYRAENRSPSNVIMEYSLTSGWKVRDEILETARFGHVVMRAPSSLC